MTHTHAFLLLLLPLLLFLWSPTQILHSSEGRPLAKALKISKEGVGGGEEMATVDQAMIGSRPPRCEGICSSCGHCEAVQVPLLPLEKEKKRRDSFKLTSMAGHDTSNYKPMNWKCKCGDMIFNP